MTHPTNSERSRSERRLEHETSDWSLLSNMTKDTASTAAPSCLGSSSNLAHHHHLVNSSSPRLNMIHLSPPGAGSSRCPPDTEGIVVQALEVVNPVVSHPEEEPQEASTHKKIAKKRRKQDGTVDVEHTKSCKEFLHQCQASTMVDRSSSQQSQQQQGHHTFSFKDFGRRSPRRMYSPKAKALLSGVGVGGNSDHSSNDPAATTSASEETPQNLTCLLYTSPSPRD